MIISLDLESDTPLYEQLRNQIVIAIATGQLISQQKLPTVRQLANDLGINTMTVNKAYTLLKQEGYIVIDRRHGAKVAWQNDVQIDAHYEKQLADKLELVIAEAVIHGLNTEDFQQRCAELFAKMKDQ